MLIFNLMSPFFYEVLIFSVHLKCLWRTWYSEGGSAKHGVLGRRHDMALAMSWQLLNLGGEHLRDYCSMASVFVCLNFSIYKNITLKTIFFFSWRSFQIGKQYTFGLINYICTNEILPVGVFLLLHKHSRICLEFCCLWMVKTTVLSHSWLTVWDGCHQQDQQKGNRRAQRTLWFV